MRRAGLTAILCVAWVLFAAPVTAQADPGPCYPTPCTAAVAGTTADQSVITSSGVVATRPADDVGPVPFVAVGLLMVLTPFSAIVLRRRMAMARRSRPLAAHVPAPRLHAPERLFQ